MVAGVGVESIRFYVCEYYYNYRLSQKFFRRCGLNQKRSGRPIARR